MWGDDDEKENGRRESEASGMNASPYSLPGLPDRDTVLERGGEGLLAEDVLAVLERRHAVDLKAQHRSDPEPTRRHTAVCLADLVEVVLGADEDPGEVEPRRLEELLVRRERRYRVGIVHARTHPAIFNFQLFVLF
jgi:hypothetical protein